MAPDDSEYIFTPTQDWFSFNIDAWTRLFPHVTSTTPRVLEIGTWEGRSAVFLLNQLCATGGSIVCIDHFDLMQTPEGKERHRKVVHNLGLTKKPHRIMCEFSFPALTKLLVEELGQESDRAGYDWIYIDGSHEADDTLLDSELVWRLAKKGAIVVFDDYRWDREPEDSIHHPKKGIDAFLAVHAGQYEVLSSPDQYQFVLKKTSEMRIGFLSSPDLARTGFADSMGYGINVAMVADSEYAIGAGVVIQSLVDKTPGRITIYVVDCGLTDVDKTRLGSSARRDDVTLVFCDLPEKSLAKDMGAVWAKVDMISVLPVERVLYLDTDVLVRADIRELWDMNLGGLPIGAVRDIGFPDGYEAGKSLPYFNAGVLLLNLALVRGEYAKLAERCRGMGDSRYREQDAFNAHFVRRWKPLAFVWNAQGLGTYANWASAARDALNLEEMKTNPRIVHFTGPVHPSLVEVLNPYLQPFTAKPWGYAGVQQGNPFTSEWRGVLDKTEWGAVMDSKEYQQKMEEKKEKAIQDGISDFKNVFTDKE